MKLKSHLFIPCFCLLITVVLITSFETISVSVKQSIDLSIKVVLPALFPFFVISDLFLSFISINENNIFCRIYKKLFKMPASTIPVFIIGLISGYPVGALSTYEIYRDGIISKSQAERLVCYVNNSGPLFIICSVGCGMLKNIKIGIMLYILHIFISLCTGIVLGIGKKTQAGQISQRKKEYNFSLSIEKSFMQCIKIIGFVIFFGIITDTLLLYFERYISIWMPDERCKLIYSVIFSIIEITNGINYASKNIDITSAVIITAFALSWSGLSVYLQTISVTKNCISLKKYLYSKFISGCVSCYFCFIILKITNINISDINTSMNMLYISSLTVMYILFFMYIFQKRKLQ